MKKIFESGDKLRITSTEEFGICFTNSVGGTSEYPMNKPLEVTVIKEWDDYEIGQRYIGITKDGVKYFFGDSGIKIKQLEKAIPVYYTILISKNPSQ